MLTLENAVLSFEEILALAHVNFEEQNKVSEPSIIMFNYLCICIYLMHSIIIIFLIMASLRNAINVKFTLEQVTKAQRGSRDIALLFL